MLYVVTRVITRKGFIVAYRALITGGRAMFEEQSIHVADVVEMSKEYSAPPIRSVFLGTPRAAIHLRPAPLLD
jgi:hypothetical protein